MACAKSAAGQTFTRWLPVPGAGWPAMCQIAVYQMAVYQMAVYQMVMHQVTMCQMICRSRRFGWRWG